MELEINNNKNFFNFINLLNTKYSQVIPQQIKCY